MENAEGNHGIQQNSCVDLLDSARTRKTPLPSARLRGMNKTVWMMNRDSTSMCCSPVYLRRLQSLPFLRSRSLLACMVLITLATTKLLFLTQMSLSSSWPFLHWKSTSIPRQPRDWSWWDKGKGDPLRTQSPPWMIFYNIFIPNETAGQRHALSIISEQLDQVRTSYAALGGDDHDTKFGTNHTLHLYYNTIGTDKILKREWMQRQVTQRGERHKIQIHFGQHFDQGNEDLTLQDVYEFCHAHPSAQAIYLHSKGSFHYAQNTEDNSKAELSPNSSSKPDKFATQDRWRQLLTKAATSRHCLQAMSASNPPPPQVKSEREMMNVGKACDTCSLLMQPLPSCHYPGNMWVASCRYIVNLLPPLGFERIMDRNVVNRFKQFRDTQGTLQTFFFPQMPHMMGRKRFASEHWLGSHPLLLNPCHVTPIANLSAWLNPSHSATLSKGGSKVSKEDLTMVPAYPAPGFSLEHEHWDFYRYGSRGPTVLHNETMRKQDYFLLPGQVLRWYQLYGTVPPFSSWVWQWFPDGPYWQDQVKKHSSSSQLIDQDLRPIVLDDRTALGIWNNTN